MPGRATQGAHRAQPKRRIAPRQGNARRAKDMAASDELGAALARYFFFFDDLRFDLLPPFLPVLFLGTFFPSFRASDRPIAIACLRLVTFLPERPLFSVPFLRFFIARA